MTGAILDIRGLKKSFGGLHVTNDLTYAVRGGALDAIIGPNGAGKSTFFNLLTGYHRADAGTIVFAGEEITRAAPERIVKLGISRAFQVSNIFHRMTVFENVRTAVQAQTGLSLEFFRPARGLALDQTDEIIHQCGLASRAGIVSGRLSQGDKKRLELALALSGKPKLLLLDEPTAGMSREEAESTMDLVAALNRDLGITVVFTEHDIAAVFKYAERITLLSRGTMIVSGTPEEIRRNEDAQKLYLGESIHG
ncbi:ABC transporter ATP-binding protein [Xanthobacter autotrophicus DSM 431]|uniref:ABC transporter ATP-binding protein n=1 Tax=Xanthobacter nonsaccharivorans TaxID=3119912 RepID=UPI00372B0874